MERGAAQEAAGGGGGDGLRILYGPIPEEQFVVGWQCSARRSVCHLMATRKNGRESKRLDGHQSARMHALQAAAGQLHAWYVPWHVELNVLHQSTTELWPTQSICSDHG